MLGAILTLKAFTGTDLSLFQKTSIGSDHGAAITFAIPVTVSFCDTPKTHNDKAVKAATC